MIYLLFCENKIKLIQVCKYKAVLCSELSYSNIIILLAGCIFDHRLQSRYVMFRNFIHIFQLNFRTVDVITRQ